MTRPALSLSALAIAALLAASGATASPMDQMMDAAHSFGEPGDAKAVTRTVTITATEIDFDVHALTFKTGDTVKFVLVNKGEQDHELMIADDATQNAHREMMAQMPGMNHEEMEKAMGGHADDDRNSLDTQPGQTKILIWHFTRPGHYEFACNYPGHAELGMIGTITVQ